MEIFEEQGLCIARIRIQESDSNYNYIAWCEETRECAVIDPIDPTELLKIIRDNGLMVKYVINTHCHPDHISGNDPIIKVALTNISKILVHPEGIERVSPRSSTIDEGDVIKVGNQEIKVIYTPGHCPEHITLLAGNYAFVGDTLFLSGCGNTKFRGVTEDLFHSIDGKLRPLPDDTIIFVGHDYAEKNLLFALDIEPENEAAQSKLEQVISAKTEGNEPAPTTIGEEKSYNPFMRYDVPEVVEELKKRNPELNTSPVEVFKELRSLRDTWT
jgi:hydroxyacylglutathione hydrolase